MIFGLISGIGWFGVFFFGHLAIAHWGNAVTKARWGGRLLIFGLVGIALSAVPASGGTGTLTNGGWWMAALWGELTYIGLYVLYTPFYYVVVASHSVRTTVMLLDAEDSTLPVAALEEEFASRSLVRQRLGAMADNGFLTERDGRHILTAKGRTVAGTFAWLKRFWCLGPGG